MAETTKPLTFFEVFNLCRALDAEHTNMFSQRKTRIYFCKEHPWFKVINIEGGLTVSRAVMIGPGDDIELELLSLHAIVDDKVKVAKIINENDDWMYPIPF
jgi:hypothetical protein